MLPTSTYSPAETISELPATTELPGSEPTSRIKGSSGLQRADSPANSERDLRRKTQIQDSQAKLANEDTGDARADGRQEKAQSTRFEMAADDFIPMALDPVVAEGPSPMMTETTNKANGQTPGSTKQEQETRGTDYFNVKEKSSRRKPIPNRIGGLSKTQASEPTSPASVLSKDASTDDVRPKAKQTNSAAAVLETAAREQPSRTNSEKEGFRLQEAPKRRKSSGQQYTGPGSKEDFPLLSLDSAPPDLTLTPQYASPLPLREQSLNIGQPDSARSSQLDTPTQRTPVTAQDTKGQENSLDIPALPKRGDSLQKMPAVQRKEVPGSRSASHESSQDGKSSIPGRSYDNSSNCDGGLVIGRPMESPISKSALNSAFTAESGDDSQTGDSFVSPRAAPPRPAVDNNKHKAKG